jgi:hypothetical protein
MNKLANTYLKAVDSLLAIHLKNPHPGHLPIIIANLADAVRALNQENETAPAVSSNRGEARRRTKSG